MWKDNLKDTISAISTAQGQGGIGIVRLREKRIFGSGDKIFNTWANQSRRTLRAYRALWQIC